MSAHQRYGALFFGTATALAVGLGFGVRSLGWLGCWLIAVTVTALAAYGFDKLAARAGWLRVPERVLLLLSFTGGTLGALVGMRLFRHKTAKQSFRLKFWLVTAAQIVLVLGYYLWLRPGW